MKISDSEKIIICLLDNISRHLNIDTDNDTISSKFIVDAIYSGNEWAIEVENNHLFGSKDEDLPPHVSEVYDFLFMWRIIEESYDSLSEEDKEKVRSNYRNGTPSFEGFDGNNESKYLLTTAFMVEKMTDCFSFLGKRCNKNSHAPKVPRYRAMNNKFKNILHNDDLETTFTADKIIEIINSR